MRIQLTSISGFAKLTKIKDDMKLVETPTIMKYTKNQKDIFWEIGENENLFSMNSPPSFLHGNITNNLNADFIFVYNFLMQQSLNETVLEKQFEKAFEELNHLKSSFNERSVALIQPTSSITFFERVLNAIRDLQISNVAITNLLPILSNHRKLVEFFTKIRTILPIDTTVFLLSPVPHTFMPILAYLGVDVFSDEYGRIATKQSLYLTDSNGYYLDELKEQFCFCAVCSKASTTEQLINNLQVNEIELEKHNLNILLKKIREIRAALKNNELRSFIEQQIQTNITSAASLRILDKEWSKEIISRTPTWSSAPIKSITSYGYYRPEVKEFQNRITNRFEILPTKKVVVILPCSARKPYSNSQSHKKFIEIIDSLGKEKIGYIQELILTSPLGVIPRQLENVYPAAHYDIPVTGDWDFEEKEIATELLSRTIEKLGSDVVIIAHVSNEYTDLCEIVEKKLNRKFIYTSNENRTTSYQSLQCLKQTLETSLLDKPPIQFNSATEKLQTLADYQYGLGIGKELFCEKYSIFGKPRLPLKVMKNKTQVGVIQPETGKLTLSLITGKILAKLKKYYVKFEGETIEGSTLFAVGVKDADQEIRPSDDVVIVNEKFDLLAVGQAIVSGKDMMSLSKGSVVKIRQKVK
ncbi:MAG TPA: tRNA-guanine transglycosylase [candidate division Zixibacteria bacterium]|nr:tRNA-guanine transglycosylase [candidate division Zixibacteria bacterium]